MMDILVKVLLAIGVLIGFNIVWVMIAWIAGNRAGNTEGVDVDEIE